LKEDWQWGNRVLAKAPRIAKEEGEKLICGRILDHVLSDKATPENEKKIHR